MGSWSQEDTKECVCVSSSVPKSLNTSWFEEQERQAHHTHLTQWSYGLMGEGRPVHLYLLCEAVAQAVLFRLFCSGAAELPQSESARSIMTWMHGLHFWFLGPWLPSNQPSVSCLEQIRTSAVLTIDWEQDILLKITHYSAEVLSESGRGPGMPGFWNVQLNRASLGSRHMGWFGQ